MASVKLTNVKKIYGKDTVAVQDFNLDIADKEFIVFVGPSGCGKSTTLRMIAGANAGVDAELEAFVLAKIEERAAAKKAKDFAAADAIRDELLAKGVAIKDTREGVKWELV